MAERMITSKEATLGGQKLFICLHSDECKCRRRARNRLFHDKQAEVRKNPNIYYASSWEQAWES